MKKTNKLILAAVLAVALPTGALAAEADLQVKIDKLSQQMEDLKGQVERIEDKSLGKWLSIGGSYQFRADSLHGKTVNYVDGYKFATYFQGQLLNAATFGATTPNPGLFFQFTNLKGQAQVDSFNTVIAPAAFTTMLPTVVVNVMGMTAGQQAAMASYVTPQVYAMFQQMINRMPAATAAAFNAQLQGLGALAPSVLGAMYSQMLTGSNAQTAAYKPKNETLYTNKFALDLKAKATKDVTVNVKLGMYKVFGAQDNTATANGAFADRVGVFDGVLGHVPSSSFLNVDRAYATWSNILDQPVWFSVGRRPATDGAPTNLKNNNERPGNGGTPALLVNYAFDGMTLGYAPDIDMLPGFYTKVCYGRGFESGYRATPTNSLKDTDMLGIAVIPVDTDPLRVWLQWNRGFNIFDFPVMQNSFFGNTAPSTDLGSIDWYGAGAMTTLKKVGPGDLNAFADFGVSVTHPNKNVSASAGYQGLMSGQFFVQDFNPKSQTGYAAFAGIRYDLPSKTKIGFEYNYGSKYWITFAPAADDMWTSKVGTRGQVFEPYVIQELNLKPISSVFAKTFFKLGYQYYDFHYTGSNNWVGEPKKISEISSTDILLMAPVKEAHNIYGTFEVHF